MFQQITLIPGIGEVPAMAREIYFDAIEIGSANCANVSSARTPRAQILGMAAFPNPAQDVLSINAPKGAASLSVLDGLGRTLMTQRFVAGDNEQLRTLDVSQLAVGTYTVFAQDADGRALARVRVSVAH